MSATTSLISSEGSAWYSACARSGALPALLAVISLVIRSSPCAGWLTLTVMSGFFWFQRSTTLAMLGAQDQKVSWTGSPLLSAGAGA